MALGAAYTLGRELGGGRMPRVFVRTDRFKREIESALVYAHQNGVVHRDIKPDNVLLAGGPQGGHAGGARMATAMVADFGVAKAIAAAEQEGFEQHRAADHAHHATSLGVALGTPLTWRPNRRPPTSRTEADELYRVVTQLRADVVGWLAKEHSALLPLATDD